MFASDEVKYLGFVITKDGVKPDPDKVRAISEMKFPRTPKAMIRFLCTVNFYREFIRNFSEISSVLYKMSQSNKKFKVKRESEEFFLARTPAVCLVFILDAALDRRMLRVRSLLSASDAMNISILIITTFKFT